MSVTINGEVVNEQDTVYDLIHGNGIVTQVTGTSFSADFGGKVFNYTTGGFYNGQPRQRVYWANPIVGAPTKADRVWTIVHNMVVALLAELRGTSV